MAKKALQLCRVVRKTLKTKAKILNGKVEEKTAQLVVVGGGGVGGKEGPTCFECGKVGHNFCDIGKV